MTAWRRSSVLLVFAVVLMAPWALSHAQGTNPFEEAQKLADAGKHRDAVAALSRNLGSGALTPANTARGFYLRGVSYAKSGKNPQAISDLTNALWLTGLNDSERSNAYETRAAAYKASGFKAKAAADLKRAKSKVAPTQTASLVPTPAPETSTTSAAGGRAAPDAWATQTANTAVTPDVKPAASKPAPTPGAGSAVSTFFGGLFGGASTSQSASAATTALSREDGSGVNQPLTTAASRTVAKSTAPARPTANETAVSSWSSNIATAEPQKPVREVVAKPKQVAAINWNTAVAATPPAKPKPAAQKVTASPANAKKATKPRIAPKGRYNVQVATVRDRATAERIRSTVSKQAPKALAGLKPSIDTAVLGNMGTFFRVRVDGLPTRQASLRLCNTLQKQGHDCFLLTR